MVDKSQDVLDFMKKNGPSLPLMIGKEIGKESYIASAYLSSLASRGEVKISNLKVGGSPLYYLPGQEADLQKYSDKLAMPERRAYELLKEKQVLRDKALEPVQRVALRSVKDFAIPLNVKHEEGLEIFWKWYMLTDKEAEGLIMNILEPPKPKPAVFAETAPATIPSAAQQQNISVPPQPVATSAAPATALKAKAEEQVQEAIHGLDRLEPIKPASEPVPQPIAHKGGSRTKAKSQEKKPLKRQSTAQAASNPSGAASGSQSALSGTKQAGAKAAQAPLEPDQSLLKGLEKPSQESLSEFIDDNPSASKGGIVQTTSLLGLPSDPFLEEIKNHFGKSGIIIKEAAVAKKGSEIDMIVELPSAVGKLTYFCKARKKAKSTEGDLASAFLQAQSRKLPCLYLAKGEIAKKALDMLSLEFKGMAVKTF